MESTLDFILMQIKVFVIVKRTRASSHVSCAIEAIKLLLIIIIIINE